MSPVVLSCSGASAPKRRALALRFEWVTAVSHEITIVECPRDAWQGMSKQIPAAVKADYLRALIAAGFQHIDAVSFVSPKAIPQMADSEAVLAELGPVQGVELIGIVVNRRGAERAIATRAVRTVGFPHSVSPTFAMRNQRQTPDESLAELKCIREAADASGMNTIAYLSMAFGNPYGEPWSAEHLTEAVERVRDAGVRVVSLADTVGHADARQVNEVFGQVKTRFPELDLGVHLHGSPETAGDMALAAYSAGCRRFDSVIGGWGGCPFAQDERIGNLPTECVLEALPVKHFAANHAMSDLLRRSREIASTYE